MEYNSLLVNDTLIRKFIVLHLLSKDCKMNLILIGYEVLELITPVLFSIPLLVLCWKHATIALTDYLFDRKNPDVLVTWHVWFLVHSMLDEYAPEGLEYIIVDQIKAPCFKNETEVSMLS